MAFVDVLPQLNLGLNEVLVAIPALVIATHAVVVAHFCHEAPGRVAVVEERVILRREHAAAPYLFVAAQGNLRRREAIVVSKETRRKRLVHLEVYAFARVLDKVARVVKKGYARRSGMQVLALIFKERQVALLHLCGLYEAVGESGTEVRFWREAEEETGNGFDAITAEACLVIILVVECVAHSVVVREEGREVELVVQFIPLVGEDVQALDADEEKAARGEVAVECGVGARQRFVGKVRAVSRCGNQAKA